MKEVVEKQNWGQKEEDMYKTVDFYALKGLRTLVFGYKRVDKDEYKADLKNIEVS
jgi:magnesium-transporting ATPase (P-type)